MKLHTKIRSLLYVLISAVLAIALLLSITFARHSATLDGYYSGYVANEVYRRLKIMDTNGSDIYSGGRFSDEQLVREATFHLIGDKNGSVPSSLLTSYVNNLRYGKLSGYQAADEEVSLTIDLYLQLTAYQALVRAGVNGTIVVVDYTTGDIKAMVSTPAVDVYNAAVVKDGAFLNKAAYAFAPGSVFKSISVAAMLEKDVTAKDFGFTCTGRYQHLSCISAHGGVSLTSALYKSCNVSVGAAAMNYLGAEELDAFALASGVLSEDISADFSVKPGNINSANDIGWTANGQSETMVTPLALTAYYAAIANGGVRIPLRVNSETEVQKNAQRIFSQQTAEFLAQSLTTGMSAMYNSPYRCTSFGKTGTAEIEGKSAHSWFASCLTDENAPPYAIITMIEHGGSSQYARNIAASYVNQFILGGG